MVELAVKKELAVLGIEANGVGRQQIDGEIRREPRDVFALKQCSSVPAVTCHEVNARTITTIPDRRCKPTSVAHMGKARGPAGASSPDRTAPGLHLPVSRRRSTP